MFIQAYAPLIGGAERQLAAQAELLSELGVEVHVLTRRWKKELLPFEKIGCVSVHRLPASGPKAVAAFQYIISAVWRVRSLRPDVLHAHELLSPATAAALAKLCFGAPLVAKVLRGGLLGDLAKIGAGRLGWLRVQLVASAVDAFAVISTEIDDELAAIGVPARKRVFIPNGVDTERFMPVSVAEKARIRAERSLPDGRLAIFSGRLEPEKRVDLLLELWPRLRRVLPDAQLLVLGTGSSESQLRQQPVEAVHFYGGVEDVAPYLHAADLFVLPSLTEGLSNSMLEAMACGLPVVATHVGGAADVITDRETGWLVPPNDPDALFEALVSLLGEPGRSQALGERARRSVLERYSLLSVAKSLRELYDRLLPG